MDKDQRLKYAHNLWDYQIQHSGFSIIAFYSDEIDHNEVTEFLQWARSYGYKVKFKMLYNESEV